MELVAILSVPLRRSYYFRHNYRHERMSASNQAAYFDQTINVRPMSGHCRRLCG
jgi:hypothetical protein